MNILLVDDHRLFAKSLSVALDEYPEIKQFYIAQNIPDLKKILCEKNIDIILLDISLGSLSDADGLEVAANLRRLHPAAKLVILTGYDLPVYRREARKIGVNGFLNKNISPDGLIASLVRVYHGNTCFPPEKNEMIIEDLTAMEKTILQQLGTGKKRKTIADELYISERTLSNHLQHIFEKLGVSSSVEAITKAIQLGYIPPLC